MELYQLVSFVAVAEEGNMTRAASRLNLTQPAVSAQVKALEEELRLPLFQRTARGMELTEEGHLLKARADVILQGVNEFNSEAEKLRGGAYGGIILGVNTDPLLLRLKDVYTRLNREYPDLTLTVQEAMSWDVVGKLNTGRIDLGFSYIVPQDAGVDVQLLGEIELTIVAPESWRERVEGKSAKELAGFPWVWTSDYCPMNAVLTDFFESIEEKPVKAIVVDQEASILNLVSDGVGLSIMPSDKVQDIGSRYRIIPVRTLDRKLALHLLCLKRRRMELKITILSDLINAVWNTGCF
ncbi:LysR family transcriptional regulator [Maridesulfovibrio sp. FT414]|uniref:LysR family transcriptional regulator n=1 Tax=Maridesulfovibrio sp. FT414 TaxID=2979469 RepID=UPI003D802A96